ncbi:MAG: arsenosugar biosynthesis radical SAM (seleno)protein ArsS [Thiohalomonadaceae bacterium]
MLNPLPALAEVPFPALQRAGLHTLQVNLGYRCNQQCLHCHVNAGPNRQEMMTPEGIALLIELLDEMSIQQLDLTGGAPEMHPQFRELVVAARERGVRVLDRCNLSILEEPDQQGLADFLAGQGVEVVASLPCYLQENVDAQRGKGVFELSIRALQRLNALGYGQPGGLSLSLVYNPQGPQLPPPQQALEQDYKQRLYQEHGIVFNQLLTITNMPIARFGSSLMSRGQLGEYMQLLQEAHLDSNLPGVMCRHLISVDWQGYLYDCDFNQMLGLGMPSLEGESARLHLRDLRGMRIEGRPIKVLGHCYGCTAGQGSSCGGALS